MEVAGDPDVSKSRSAIVLGAGAIGLCTALALSQRGVKVKLVDRKAVAEETSYGNAGIVATNAVLPLLSSGELRKLPALALAQSPKLRYNPLYAMANMRELGLLVTFATQAHAERTAAALGPVIRRSASEYQRLASQANLGHLLSTGGWFHLYRSKSEWDRADRELKIIRDIGTDMQAISRSEIHDLDPHIKPIFHKGVWYKDSLVCRNPGALLKGLADYFTKQGGEICLQEAKGFLEEGNKCAVSYVGGETDECDILVIALGTWSRDFLRPLAKVPLIVERGYHAHFPPVGDAELRHPFLDVEQGYVLNHMHQGLRITTGTELNFPDAPPSHAQLHRATRAAREAFPIDKRDGKDVWMGRRPTLPDSLPMIGFLGNKRNVLLAFGHQHIGLSMAPGTGEAVAAMATGGRPPFDIAPFKPSRFINPGKAS